MVKSQARRDVALDERSGAQSCVLDRASFFRTFVQTGDENPLNALEENR